MHKLTGQIWYFHIKHVDQFFNGPHKQHIMIIIKQKLKNISSSQVIFPLTNSYQSRYRSLYLLLADIRLQCIFSIMMQFNKLSSCVEHIFNNSNRDQLHREKKKSL